MMKSAIQTLVFNFGEVRNFAEVRWFILIALSPLRGLGGFIFLLGFWGFVHAQTPTEQLWRAVKDNDLPKAQETLKNGADVNAKDEKGAPILWWAVMKGELPLVKYLVEKGANYQAQKGSITCGGGCFYGNLTGIAAGENKLDILQYLIETLRIPVNDKEWHPEKNGYLGWTALQWSLNRKFDSITAYLLKEGAVLLADYEGYEDSKYEFDEYDNRINPTYKSLAEALKNPLGVIKLDLSGQVLTEFPKEILQCKNLRVLNLGWKDTNLDNDKDSGEPTNNIKVIPTEIDILKYLTYLRLSGNQLQDLPASIGNLKELTYLSLAYNQLTALPAQIGDLRNLQTLYCSRNQLTALPVQIGDLRNLQTLDCWGNQLTALPAQIGDLKNLQTLNCFRNQLTSLPAQIGELKNLQILHYFWNQLTSLPTQIGDLKNLQTLDCWGNQLTALPAQIGDLKNLQTLNCGDNQLTALPAQIGELKNLQSLWCEGNQLTSLPAQIGELKNLQSLRCSRNQLTSLPTQIGELKNLQSLDCSGNPFTNIKPELFNFLSKLNYGESNEIRKIVAEYGAQAEANRQNIESQKLAAEIRSKELEAKNLRAEAARERDKNKADSLRRLAERADLEAKVLREEQQKREVQSKKDRLEREALQAGSRYQTRIFWITVLVAALVLAWVLGFLYVVNRNRSKIQRANQQLQEKTEELEALAEERRQIIDELQEKTQELEALAEELRQQNDTVAHQRDDLIEKSNELEALAEELRQQNDTVAHQRDDLIEKSNELEALAEELRQQNEVVDARNLELQALQSTKDLMISAVNHDLRNPLNPIINFSGHYPKKTEQERLAEIHTHAHLMLKLIDNIMQVYRADTLTIQATPNSLHRAANEAIQVMSLAQSRKPQIINEIPADLQAMFDYNYLERVFENLLSNAIKYTPAEEKGGIVRFTATLIEGTASGLGGLVRVSASDNGKGIPREQFERIFLPFVNPDAKSIGSAKSVGIGLTFCKTIIEAHQSKIEIESEVGKGTTFSFVLPYVMPELKEDNQEAAGLDYVQLSEAEKQEVQNLITEIQKIGFNNAKLKRFLQGMDVGNDEQLLAWKAALLKAREARDKELFEQMLGA